MTWTVRVISAAEAELEASAKWFGEQAGLRVELTDSSSRWTTTVRLTAYLPNCFRNPRYQIVERADDQFGSFRLGRLRSGAILDFQLVTFGPES